MSALVLLALPAATGLASVLWAQITAGSRLTMAGLNVLSYAAVLLIVAAWDGPAPSRSVPMLPALAYVALSIAVSLLWFRAAPTASIGVLALTESAYPLVVLAVSRLWAGGPSLTGWQWVGAVLVTAGVPLVAAGGHDG